MNDDDEAWREKDTIALLFDKICPQSYECLLTAFAGGVKMEQAVHRLYFIVYMCYGYPDTSI